MLEKTKKFLKKKFPKLSDQMERDDKLIRMTWKERCDFTILILMEYSKYLVAMCETKKGDRFKKKIEQIEQSLSTENNHINNARHNPIFEDDVYIAVLKLILATGYKPPDHLIGLQIHLQVIRDYYLTLLPSMDCNSQTANMLVDSALMKLEWDVFIFSSAMRSRMTDKDRSNPGAQAMKKKKEKQIIQAVEQIETKNCNILTKDGEKKAKRIIKNKLAVNRKTAQRYIKEIKSNIR